jgi:hypothetical protein
VTVSYLPIISSHIGTDSTENDFKVLKNKAPESFRLANKQKAVNKTAITIKDDKIVDLKRNIEKGAKPHQAYDDSEDKSYGKFIPLIIYFRHPSFILKANLTWRHNPKVCQTEY